MTEERTRTASSALTTAINREHSDEARRSAAAIWSRATARRDGLSVAVPLEEKLAGIESALDGAGSTLFITRIGGEASAFAILLPRAEVLEVLYLAVDTRAWGQGLAGALLEHLRRHAELAKASLELWVIEDNTRAIRSYERAGWTKTTEIKVRNSSGREERRFTLSHSEAPPS